MSDNFVFVGYEREFSNEILRLWRESFHRAIGMEEDTKQEVVREHLEVLQSLNPDFIRVALEGNTSKIIGFMRMEENIINDLFIHVDYQRQGLGSRFIQQAKEEKEFLSLSTFELNKGAQKFYEHHDFVISRRGFASFEENPWATNQEQLADITYEWSRE